MEHKVTEESIPSNVPNMSAVVAVCTCGWRGTPWHAYNDDQLYQVRRDGERHMARAAKEEIEQ